MASILPFLFVYVVSTPNFAAMLVTNSTALGRFLRQVMTNGLPVVFIVNYIGFVFAHNTLNNPDRSEIGYIVLDGLLRSATFIAIHILVYVLSADLFGSFSGNRATAVSVVGPTLERSFIFHNISGVYLYAVVPGAFIALLAVLTKRSGETSDTSKSKNEEYSSALQPGLDPRCNSLVLRAEFGNLTDLPGQLFVDRHLIKCIEMYP